ncbi:MAG: sialidase family protein [Bacteroidota bacterium]|nr:sialidase family protein [Bacteroidota bacterium]MDP4234015.1 sialidase family protein [Bacteroidota bacterium]MDP4242881.1 sialidase family protein [Bacteroidota bacterium]MDP4287680.1 sialidase family protein [Bacteroidota bacterium]
MKWLFIAFLFCSAIDAEAQWLVPPASWMHHDGYDRPRPSRKPRMRPLSMPAPEPHNWPFPNTNVTHQLFFAQTEPSIAINPTDPSNVVIGANDDSIYNQMLACSSTDDGATWLNQSLPGVPLWAQLTTDPSVSFDRFGTVYYLFGRLGSEFGVPQAQNEVALYRSSNRGAKWLWAGDAFADTASSWGADTLSDKYYLAVDVNASSPYVDRLYAVWVDYGQTDGLADSRPHIVCSHSTDSGVHWSHRVSLAGGSFFTAPVPALAPDGTLIVTFIQYWDTNAIWVTRSTDGGQTFSAPHLLSQYKNLAGVTPNDSTGYQTIGTDTDFVMINSFPSIAISDTGAHKGRTYICWCGKSDDGVPHVWIATSDDAGVNWSAPRIADADSVPNAYSRYFSWVAADPQTGDLAIDYYVAPTGPSNIWSDLYMEHSTDGGATFSARRISSASSSLAVKESSRQTNSGQRLYFIGDYINLAGWNNTWHPGWADSRSMTDLDIYTAKVQPFAPMPVSNLAVRDTTVNGKKAVVIAWDYTPETTFGYPLSEGYTFLTWKDAGKLDTLSSSTLQFVDTSSTLGYYKVSVLASGLESIRDSGSNLPRSVSGDLNVSGVHVLLLRQPAVVGNPDAIRIESDVPSSLSLTFYDELGRTVCEPESDGAISTKHTITFTPQQSGVMFYVIRGVTATGVWQRTGRLLAE